MDTPHSVVDWDMFAVVQGQGWTVDDNGNIRNANCECPGVALAKAVKVDTHMHRVDIQYATVMLWPWETPTFREIWRQEVYITADFEHAPNRLHLMYALGMIEL